MLTSLATGDLWMIMQLFLETSPGMSVPLMRLWLILTAKRTIITTPVTVQVEIKFKKGDLLTKKQILMDFMIKSKAHFHPICLEYVRLYHHHIFFRQELLM